MDKKNLGDAGEQFVCDWLAWQGYRILDRNIQTPYGEIDIWAALGSRHYLVEVKTRRHRQIDPVVDGLNHQKSKRMLLVRSYFCNQRRHDGPAHFFCAFAWVVPAAILWIPNIFNPHTSISEAQWISG